MAAHRTVRAFRSEAVPDEVVQRAVAAAQRAATSSWIQAYALIAVSDPTERQRLVELTGGQPQVAEAGAFYVICAEVRRHQLVYDDHQQTYHGNLETFLLATIDASLFAQNLVLAFESQGYGTCFIGGLRNDLPAVDRLLQIPEGVWPLFGLCVGKEAVRPEAEPGLLRPRLPVSAVLMKDRYLDDDASRAAIAAHDEASAEYFTERGHPERRWSTGLARKFAKPLRPELFDYYTSKGARLQ